MQAGHGMPPTPNVRSFRKRTAHAWLHVLQGSSVESDPYAAHMRIRLLPASTSAITAQVSASPCQLYGYVAAAQGICDPCCSGLPVMFGLADVGSCRRALRGWLPSRTGRPHHVKFAGEICWLCFSVAVLCRVRPRHRVLVWRVFTTPQVGAICSASPQRRPRSFWNTATTGRVLAWSSVFFPSFLGSKVCFPALVSESIGLPAMGNG